MQKKQLKTKAVAGAKHLFRLWVLALPGAAVAGTGPSVQPVLMADGLLSRPATEPCQVELFSQMAFTRSGEAHRMDNEPHGFDFQPPQACHGPWAKIVLEADFSVDAGRQFDRTASLWLGGINLFYGTTQEPSATSSPSWHVERDVTDYSALFSGPQHGQMDLNNFVGGIYTSTIHASARLVFYPASDTAPAAIVADAVYPLHDAKTIGPTPLASSSDRLASTLNLPRNVVHAYIDLIAQSQGNDEPWYTCVADPFIPDSAPFALEAPFEGAPVQQCNGGSFRVARILIDDQPAGLAPIFPWTYTGGIDPYLWRPTPDVQTLNFIPYRLDLTPFAALLSDGKPHTISVNVQGANRFFNVVANLLIYRDPKQAQVSGALLQNTLAAVDEVPKLQSTLRHAHGRIEGNLSTLARQHYVIEGYVQTPEGRRRTRVEESLDFSNRQHFDQPQARHYHQRIDQESVTDQHRSTWLDDRQLDSDDTHWEYPLHLDVDKRFLDDNTFIAAITMSQGYIRHALVRPNHQHERSANVKDVVSSQDVVHFNALGDKVLGHSDQHSSQHVDVTDSLGSCYHSDVHSLDGEPAGKRVGEGCPQGLNHLHWRAHPDDAS